MVHDPVMADLDRHLAQKDREDARSEEAEEIIQDWMKETDRVSEDLSNSELLQEEDFLNIVVAAVASGDWSRVQGYVEDGLRQRWDEAVEAELDRREEQNRRDAEEARDIARECSDDF